MFQVTLTSFAIHRTFCECVKGAYIVLLKVYAFVVVRFIARSVSV